MNARPFRVVLVVGRTPLGEIIVYDFSMAGAYIQALNILGLTDSEVSRVVITRK